MQVLAELVGVGFGVGRPWNKVGDVKTWTEKATTPGASIIAEITPGEERGDAQCPGLRVR